MGKTTHPISGFPGVRKVISYSRTDMPLPIFEGDRLKTEKDDLVMANRSALAALKKLEDDRTKLDERQMEMEAKAAAELGRILLGNGMEAFAPKTLGKIAKTLGKMNENEVLTKLGIGSSNGPVKSCIYFSKKHKKRPRQKTGEA